MNAGGRLRQCMKIWNRGSACAGRDFVCCRNVWRCREKLARNAGRVGEWRSGPCMWIARAGGQCFAIRSEKPASDAKVPGSDIFFVFSGGVKSRSGGSCGQGNARPELRYSGRIVDCGRPGVPASCERSTEERPAPGSPCVTPKGNEGGASVGPPAGVGGSAYCEVVAATDGGIQPVRRSGPGGAGSGIVGGGAKA
jgi:hypothetical protein